MNRLANIDKEKLSKYFKNALFACWFGVCNPYGSSSFETIPGTLDKAKLATNAFVGVSALVAVIVLVYAAYTFIMSGGDEEKISKASSMITAAVIGLVIIFTASLVIRYVMTEILKV